jgi:hypothetical protein
MKVEHQQSRTSAKWYCNLDEEGLATIPGVSKFSRGSIGKPVIRGLECQSCFGFTHKGVHGKPTVW